MKLPSTKVIAFNGAALLMVAASLGTVVRSLVITDDAPMCTERYEQGTRMPLEINGAPMSIADVQARLNGNDWGLLGGAQVVKLKNGPAPAALELKLDHVPRDRDNAETKPGIGYVWSPQSLKRTTASCLSYAVFLPEKFDFGATGRLPGLMGANPEKVSDTPLFSARLQLNEQGILDVHTSLNGKQDWTPLLNAKHEFKMPRGRWVAIQQEVVLNEPGKANGVVRVWIDDVLQFENDTVLYQDAPGGVITGVLAETTVMGRLREVAVAGASQKVWMSPLELRWK